MGNTGNKAKYGVNEPLLDDREISKSQNIYNISKQDLMDLFAHKKSASQLERSLSKLRDYGYSD